MFKRNKTPQRPELSFTPEQIIEDIMNVAENADERKKLFECVDEKVPVREESFIKMKRFLRGHETLEDVSHRLKGLCGELVTLEKEWSRGDERLRSIALRALNNLNE